MQDRPVTDKDSDVTVRYVSVAVQRPVYSRLLAIAAKLQTQRGRRVSMSEAIDSVLTAADEDKELD